MSELTKPGEVPWRIFVDGKFYCTLDALDAGAAISKVNERLGTLKAPTVTIKAYRANSASD